MFKQAGPLLFYYAEQRQQNFYTCISCNGKNDVLGRYGYCSICGTTNAIQELNKDIESASQRSEAGNHSGALCDLVSGFDAFARHLMSEMTRRTPMRPRRKEKLSKVIFHNLESRSKELLEIFDINLFDRISDDDIAFIKKLFLRRHVYEHNGGEVDQRYLDESGDKSVRLKQRIRESDESFFRVKEVVKKIAANYKNGFHDIFPPEPIPIQHEKARQERIKESRKS